MKEEILNKIGQLQYEISILGLDKEELTGVSIRTDELKDMVVKLFCQSDVIKSVCDQCRFESECRFKAENVEQNCKFFINKQTVL